MTDINWRPISEEPPEGYGYVLIYDEGQPNFYCGWYGRIVRTLRLDKSLTHYALINPPGGRDE